MSESPRADVVRAFTERIALFDFDGAHELVTDDFRYKTDPPPAAGLELGCTGVLDKAMHKKYCNKIAERFTNLDVTIDSMTEIGDTIIVKSRFQTFYVAGDIAPIIDSPFNVVYTFSGNQIKFVNAVTDPEFIAKYFS